MTPHQGTSFIYTQHNYILPAYLILNIQLIKDCNIYRQLEQHTHSQNIIQLFPHRIHICTKSKRLAHSEILILRNITLDSVFRLITLYWICSKHYGVCTCQRIYNKHIDNTACKASKTIPILKFSTQPCWENTRGCQSQHTPL